MARNIRPKITRKGQTIDSCQDCNVLLDDSNWTKSNQKYKRYICGKCWVARQKKYEKSDPEGLEKRRIRVKARMAEWSPERKLQEQRRRYNNALIKKYGITILDYDLMLLSQNNLCAICKRKEQTGRGVFHVDHCHVTGRVRGLLCSKCNMMLGLAEDSPETLVSAIRYLEVKETK